MEAAPPPPPPGSAQSPQALPQPYPQQQPAGTQPLPPAPPAPPGYAPYPYPYPYAPPGTTYEYAAPPPIPSAADLLPDDAAVRTTPFIDLLVGSYGFDQRVGSFFNIGAQAGAYLGQIVRLSGRVMMTTDDVHDNYSQYDDSGSPDAFIQQDSKDASLLYGFTGGIVAVSTKTFVLSPGVMFMRTDVSDYGSVIGLSLPFEWTTARGVRIGFELDLGRGFGGSVKRLCQSASGTTPCASGTSEVDRPAGTALYLHFQIGWGFNHPGPAKRAAQ
jgi:hypothetical protein